jgi:outer membrane lipoprotein LolB
VPGPAPQGAWQARQQRLLALTDWSIQGRIAVNRDGEAWNAGLSWQQRGERFHLQINSPLGQGLASIDGDGRRVRIQLADRSTDEGPDAETLMQRHLGWQVPMGGLRYWVRGLPEPAPASREELDPSGRLSRLRQSGWAIEYRDYSAAGDLDLPRKLFMQTGQLEVRLLISRWDLGS